MFRLRLEEWPSQGRIGLARRGDWAGEYIFVFPEIRGHWALFSSGGNDEVVPEADYLEALIREMDVEWLEGDRAECIEREVFRMRPIVASQFDEPDSIFVALKNRFFSHGSRSIDTAIEEWERRLRS